MSTLNWRTADIKLADKLIPNPNAQHELLDKLTRVRVAIDGAFLHIDPRSTDQPDVPGQDTYDVHVVPAALVRMIAYKENKPRGNFVAFV